MLEPYQSAIGEITIGLDWNEGGVISVWACADAFEMDNERYPEFPLLDVIMDGLKWFTFFPDGTTPTIDAEFAASLRQLMADVSAVLDSMPEGQRGTHQL